jgi:hypothetical protein
MRYAHATANHRFAFCGDLLAVLIWRRSGWAGARSGYLRLTRMRVRYSLTVFQRHRTLETSRKLSGQRSSVPTLFAVAFLVSRIQRAVRCEPAKMNGTCGMSALEPFASFDHDTQSLRTSQHCLALSTEDSSTELCRAWPRSGMMRNGKCFERAISASPIAESESLFLPTPQASDGAFRGIKRPVTLSKGAYRIRSNQGQHGGAKLADISWNVWGGPLNPRYVEAMMGYPPNWLNVSFTPSATPSSRSARSKGRSSASKNSKPNG